MVPGLLESLYNCEDEYGMKRIGKSPTDDVFPPLRMATSTVQQSRYVVRVDINPSQCAIRAKLCGLPYNIQMTFMCG